MKISTILDQIDLGAMALPEFQRGYVWNRNQVRDLMTSLYQRHPIGGLLVWVTKTEHAKTRGGAALQPGSVKLILDGQQRITSIYGITKGSPPPFFQGNASAFSRLHFNLETEVFEFYGPVKMDGNPYWIDVTRLMRSGLAPFIEHINSHDDLRKHMAKYISRLTSILGIADVEVHIDEVTGEDKTVDVVVDIFNKVNSGGTKLSKGDLALARICAEWPEAREKLRRNLELWQRAGFSFQMEWLLRSANTVLTGEAMFSALKDTSAAQFQKGLDNAVAAINYLLNVVSARLGLDHDRVLGGRYAFPVMTRYLTKQGGKFHSAHERDRLLYWYVHAMLWGRYAGATESTMNQDLGAMEKATDPVNALIDQMRLWRGDLVIRPEDFRGWSLGARFYPLLYLLTRVGNAQDWGSGIALRASMLGKLSRLEVHHIFPKALLYKQGLGRDVVNALANFCFQPQGTNLNISDEAPEVYFERIEQAFPGALASQWVPMDRSLWKVKRYREFVEARQALLAEAANQFLDGLLSGTVPETKPMPILPPPISEIGGGMNGDDEEELLLECNLWAVDQGLPEGELLYEVTNDTTGEPLVIIDLAWPDGLQPGLSDPIAILIGESPETEEIVNSLGYRFFTDMDNFKTYVRRDVLGLESAEDQLAVNDDPSAVSVDDIRLMLTRRQLPPAQLALYQALHEAGSNGLYTSELAAKMNRSAQELAGVLGALGNRINNTKGLRHKGGISAIFLIDSTPKGEWHYVMRPVLREALAAEGIL